MSYYKKIVECLNGMTFITKYAGIAGHGGKRAPRSEPTPEQKKQYNIRKAAERLYHTLLCNFRPGDYNLVFTYPAGTVMDAHEAKNIFGKFLRLYRRHCQEHNYACDYVYNTEIGKKGKLHHHCVMHCRKDREIIEDLWESVSGGSVQYYKGSKLWANYDWYGLALYFVDRTKGGKLPDTHALGERRYITSKGLKKPKVRIERIDADRWNKPRAPKGYEIIPGSIRSGSDELTGGNFIKYAMRRLI